MRKMAMILACLLAVTCTNAQEMKTIQLNQPSKTRGEAVMKAFDQRKSIREYADRELSVQDLSDLLWAANGFNRPEKRTAGTAMNMQEIDIYVCMKGGAYLYDAKAHELKQVTREDVRPHLAAQQEFAATAPAIILIVADMTRTRDDSEHTIRATAYDAGIVSQNISLFCAGCGLGTVCRGFMDVEATRTALGLPETTVLHLNHPVGYLQ